MSTPRFYIPGRTAGAAWPLTVFPALTLVLVLGLALPVQAEIPGVLKGIRHVNVDVKTDDGRPFRATRLFVHLRSSDEDPMPPGFRPKMDGFSVTAAFGEVTIRRLSSIGHEESFVDGRSVLLLLDLSGSMAAHWDQLHKLALEVIDGMEPNDEVGIGVFGANWFFSGFRSTDDRASLRTWIDRQLPGEKRRAAAELREKHGEKEAEIARFIAKHGKEMPVNLERGSLYEILARDAIPAMDQATRTFKGMLVVSHMVHESARPYSPNDVRKCAPENGCMDWNDAYLKAEERSLPMVGIGLTQLDPDTGKVVNGSSLALAKEFFEATQGVLLESADLSASDGVVNALYTATEGLLVLDLSFCRLPAKRMPSNYVSVHYADSEAQIFMESRSYEIPLEGLGNAPDCPRPCRPRCGLGTHTCQDGQCIQVSLPGAPERPVLPDGIALPDGMTPPPRDSAQLPGSDAPAPTTPETAVAPGTSVELPVGSAQIPPPQAGVAEANDKAVPMPLDPADDAACSTDVDCRGVCLSSRNCLCLLVEKDPGQCSLAPADRQGAKHCIPGPEACAEFEYLTDDGHCRCKACTKDLDCRAQFGLDWDCVEGICRIAKTANNAGDEVGTLAVLVVEAKEHITLVSIVLVLTVVIVAVLVRRRRP